MKSSKNIAILALLLAGAAPAAADVPAPNNGNHKAPPRPAITTTSAARTPMTIEPSGTATEARLLIPRSVIAQFRAELDNGEIETVAATSSAFNMSNTQTVVAGLFLSLALGFGGMWLVNSRKRADRLTRAALGLALVALCGATATIAYANAGPPPVARSLTSRILVPAAQSGAYGQVKVVIVDEGDGIRLVLPKQKD